MKWRLLMGVALVVAAAWGSPGNATSEIPRNVRADLEYLKALVAGDPEKDARSAISKRNLEFLGVAGYSVMVPAGEESDIGGCLKKADKVKLIRGTSDVIYGDEHISLIRQATKYAARYNSVVARERGLSVSGGCWPSNTGVQRSPNDGRR
jgi:hypothetical protein